MFTTILAVVAAILCYVIMTWKPRLRYIPGEPCNLFYGHLFMVRMETIHRQLESWSKKYGPIVRLQLADKTRVSANDYESIYQIAVTQGRDFSGRPSGRRGDWLTQQTGILLSRQADDTWKALRKSAHKHLKQFGEGMSRLENVITEVAEDMFSELNRRAGQEFDPHQVVFDTALNSIAFLITGTRTHTGEPVVEKMRYVEEKGPTFLLSAQLKYFIYEVLPSLRHLRLSGWRDLESVMDEEAEIWRLVKQFQVDDTHLESLVTVMMDQVNTLGCPYQEKDVRKTAVSLLFAGVTTTSASFYAAINILAHNPTIQTTMYGEFHNLVGSKPVVLKDRPNLPYTQSVILELLRYTSVVAMGIPHRPVRDVMLKGYLIPKDTVVYTNLWALHHDENFWGDPFEFRPDRFLDDDGKVVPADHPNRKHLMPFGAGTRVCLGESLALARLFLWITTLVQRFEIVPSQNSSKSDTDPRRFELEAVLRPIRYSVIFNPRE